MANVLNRLRIVRAYYGGRTAPIFPQEIVLELTNHCNLSCVMCPHGIMTRGKGFMDWDLFRSIIDQVKGRTELVYLHGTGESLLHKRVADYIRYAADRGLTTCLSTNGIPLTDHGARQLLQSGLDHLIVALDGGTKETYERIRVGGDFERLVANIRLLLRLHRELRSSTRITLQLIVMKENRTEAAQFARIFTAEERERVFQIRLKPRYDTYAGTSTQEIRHTRPCFWLWNMMAIAWDGSVQLCCMDYDAKMLSLNARDQTILDIWNSSPFEQFRRRHKALDLAGIPLCGTCDIPEQGYFSPAAILVSPLLSADMVRRLIPIYERIVLGTGRLGKA